MSSLTHKVRRSAVSLLSVRATFVVGMLLQQVIVARIVEPSVFGLMSLALLTMYFLFVFSETGITGSVILEEEVGEKELHFAWTVQVLRGVLLALILVGVSPIVSTFFRQPELVDLLRVMAIAPLLDGIASPGLLLLRREVAFGRLGVIQLSEIVVRLGLSIPLAIAWGNAWALVFPFVLASAVKTGLSFVVAPKRIGFVWDRDIASRFSRFGRWAFVNSVLNFFINQGDNIVVGRMMNASALGLYSMAYRLGNMPFSELGYVIGDVAFPALRRAESRIESAFLNLYGAVCSLTFPMAIGLAVVAEPFTHVVLGDQWLDMIPAFQILSVWGAVRSLTVVTGPLFNALGKPYLQSRTASLRTLVLVAALIPATGEWGITGTAAAVLLGSVVEGPLALFLAYKAIRYDMRSLGVLTGVPLGASLVMAFSVLLVQQLMHAQSPLILLAISIVTGAVLYVVMMILAVSRSDYQGLSVYSNALHDYSQGIVRKWRA